MENKPIFLQEVYVKKLPKVIDAIRYRSDEILSIPNVLERLSTSYESAKKNKAFAKIGSLYIAPTDFFEKSSGQRLFFAVERNHFPGCTSPLYFKAFCKAGEALMEGYRPTIALTRKANALPQPFFLKKWMTTLVKFFNEGN